MDGYGRTDLGRVRTRRTSLQSVRDMVVSTQIHRGGSAVYTQDVRVSSRAQQHPVCFYVYSCFTKSLQNCYTSNEMDLMYDCDATRGTSSASCRSYELGEWTVLPSSLHVLSALASLVHESEHDLLSYFIILLSVVQGTSDIVSDRICGVRFGVSTKDIAHETSE